jgi:hypothetical protein
VFGKRILQDTPRPATERWPNSPQIYQSHAKPRQAGTKLFQEKGFDFL